MKKLIAAALFATIITSPAFAITFSLVQDQDTGNCAAVVTSQNGYPGMDVVGDKTYSSQEEADKALDSVKTCKTFVR
ncbi:MAG: hypothetical protein AB1508_15740 [Pseudomonadota bacterium]